MVHAKTASTALLAASVAAGRVGVRLVQQSAEDIERRMQELKAREAELAARIEAGKARAKPHIDAAEAKRERRRQRNIRNAGG